MANAPALPRLNTTSLAVGMALALAGCSGGETGYGGGSVAPSASSNPADSALVTVQAGDEGAGTFADEGTQSADLSVPFAMPDPTATSLLGRFGYPALLASADALSSERWLQVYTDIADTLPELLGGEPAPRAAATFECPDGGSAEIARANAGAPGQPDAFDYRFTDCQLPGVTLDGGLRQSDGLAGTRFSTSRNRLSRFDGLVLVEADGARTELNGEIDRTRTALSVPQCAGETGSATELDIAMDSARIEQAGALPLTLNDVRYRSRDERGLSDRGDCVPGQHLTFDGTATARLTSDDAQAIDWTLGRQGSISRPTSTDDGPATGQALLTVSASDGSRLSVTTTDVDTDAVRIDLSDGAVTTAVETTFRFER